MELSRHIVVSTYPPNTCISKAGPGGPSEHKFFMVLDGTMTGWRRAPKRDEKGQLPKDSPEARAIEIAQEKGSIPAAKGVNADETVYRPSLWGAVEFEVLQALVILRLTLRALPTSGPAMTPSMKALTRLMNDAAASLNSWNIASKEQMCNDCDDLRNSEVMLDTGHQAVLGLHQIYVMADRARQEQMLLKFFLQLQTYKYDSLLRMPRPFTADGWQDYEEKIIADDYAYVVVDAEATEHPVVHISPGATKLLGWTIDELSKTWTPLQNKGDKSEWFELARLLQEGDSKLCKTMLSRQRGDNIACMMYAAPVVKSVADEWGYLKDRAIQWVLCFRECTPAAHVYEQKPTVEQTNVTLKRLIQIIHRNLQVSPPSVWDGKIWIGR